MPSGNSNVALGKGTLEASRAAIGNVAEREEVQQSAIDAVRQWTYKPFLVNGDPVEVKTSINVIYTLKK